MLDNLQLKNIVFIDIETVGQYPEFKKLPKKWKSLWEKKSAFLVREEKSAEELYDRAGIYAEFGKIICISVGIYRKLKNKPLFRIKSFYGDDEKALLTEFADLLKSNFSTSDYLLCAHNGKEFDFPYLARRMLVHHIPLPHLLDIAGRKPWEVQHLDTLQLWKFGDYKHYTSLDLLTALFGIKSPKNQMDGSEVGKTYWEENNLKKIVTYCENDTLAVAQLLLSYMGKPLLKENEVEISTIEDGK